MKERWFFHESLSQTGQEPDQLLWRMAAHG
jgi:hypothetical protein